MLLSNKLYGKDPVKPAKKEELFKVSMAGYSFVKFNLEQSLKMMKRMDLHYLCIKDFHLPLKSTDEEIAAFHAKLKESNVTGYGVGPIYMNTEAEIDNGFAYAKRVGVNLIVGVPKHELLPYVEKKVKEYDFKYAIHLHGPDMPDKYPDADDVWSYVKDLDPRMGICLDVGHDTRNGKDPVADLKKYQARVFDVHIKNVTAASKAGRTCEMGRGIIDIPAFVRMLRKVKYSGACSLEFEKDMDDPLAGLAESIGYFKGVIDATK
ncbi:MAG: sugar phosphate isomerase/epimerase [Prevotellaceae bacterium]|nr:sugar phosphate isomerase/epimerase [Prevotellaceae bacterium]